MYSVLFIMLTKLERAVEIFRNNGIFALLSATNAHVHHRLQIRYWKTLPTILKLKTLEVGNNSDRFEVGPSAGEPRTGLAGERDQIKKFLDELRDSDIIFDIGANIGLYTCFAARKCTDGTVVAFEPYPPNVRQVQKNVSHNDLKNVVVKQIALSNKDGSTSFSKPPNEYIGFSSGSLEPEGSSDTSQVKTAKGESLVADGKVPQPNVVKIDVEGAEPVVSKGLRRVLANDECRAVFCEIHPSGHRPGFSSINDFGMTPKELEDWFQKIGFDRDYLTERAGQLHLKMIK